MDSLTACVQQQQTQHLSAADAQQRQLHAFNLALLEQAEELAALQALLGAPSRKRQSSRRRVTEDLVDSLDNLQVGLWPAHNVIHPVCAFNVLVDNTMHLYVLHCTMLQKPLRHNICRCTCLPEALLHQGQVYRQCTKF